jgi:natural product biosynthesis luciferase-like monooxygenase protein
MSDCQIVDAYPLSSLQQGMLFHHLQALGDDARAGVDVEQMVGVLREPIDLAAFARAWSTVAARHPILRTRFRWQGRDRPVQEVLAAIDVPYSHHDLGAIDAGAQTAAIDAFLEKDRRAGFDLAEAPLFRVALFELGPRLFQLVFTYSHAILDGCVSAVLREVFATYEAHLSGATARFVERRPYRDHLLWLDEHLVDNAARAQTFFRGLLAGFAAQTDLSALERARERRIDRRIDGRIDGRIESGATSWVGYGETKFALSRATSDALRALARQHDLRDATLVEAAWALTISAFTGADDVVFGATRACRRSAPTGSDDTFGLFINTLPVRAKLSPRASLLTLLVELRAQQVASRAVEQTPLVDAAACADVPVGSALFDTIVVMNDRHNDARLKALGGAWLARDFDWHDQTSFGVSLMAYGDPELHFKLSFDRRRFEAAAMEKVAQLVVSILETIARQPMLPLGAMPLVSLADRARLEAWNATDAPWPLDATIHAEFAAQVERSPDATALVSRAASLTYRALGARVNALAARLVALGVGADDRVAVFVERSVEMVVAVLGVLAAGGAYVPIDPAYPGARVAMMLGDARAKVVVTHSKLRARLPAEIAERVERVEIIDIDRLGSASTAAEPARGSSADLAYVIFTSGSTGRPKGVMVTHANVSAFFAAMDRVLGREIGTWLAVTSLSFDISVLELLWTLTRGFALVLHEDLDRASLARHSALEKEPVARSLARSPMEFSLFYFAADASASGEKYRLLIEGAKFADTHGFTAVWTPERHFHPFGGLYPNPSVVSAALAVLTKNLQIRAGSIVLPLHNPIRCAEEWSVVDNLSNGRIGLSFASGWHASDFALAPDAYADRRARMRDGIETIRALFRGESVPAKSGDGRDLQVKIFPPPIQRAPPIWITSGGSPETFRMAGTMGANVLTNLLVMSPDALAGNIAAYRQAYRDAGHVGEGHVTLMLHTFVGEDAATVKRRVRDPFTEYLRTSTDLISKARWETTAFGRPGTTRAAEPGAPDARLDGLTTEETDALLAHAFERYFETCGLFGTPESCAPMVARFRGIGVDEIACLVDFGVDDDAVLEGLRSLDALRTREVARAQQSAVVDANLREDDGSIAAQILQHRVTHLQCTPSLATLLAQDKAALAAIGALRCLLLGGEALPRGLVDALQPHLAGALFNMYGPTETTIWSTSARVGESGSPITIGRPIANTRCVVVDRHLRALPIGVPGELLIGGAGVARGYLDRPELTAERFVALQSETAIFDGRFYRTGDLARWRDDWTLEFLGRTDHQIKLRGQRIELGEIEAAVCTHPAVREAIVLLRRDAATAPTLVAYVVARATPRAIAGADNAPSPWRAVWDEAYATRTGASTLTDPSLDFAGWKSSFTGAPIPEDEMREWVERTVERVLALAPKRVLEIGVGTGMLLLRVAPRCEAYVGIDFSDAAIATLRSLPAVRALPHVSLHTLAADRLDTLLDEPFDTVVINSVVQYLADVDALLAVLDRAFERLAPGGTLFVGDVRSLPLLRALHVAIELDRAGDADLLSDVAARVDARRAREAELVVDPLFFSALRARWPALAAVRIRLKSGASDNELTRFRYDVVLTRRDDAGAPPVEVIAEVHDVTRTPIDLEGVRRLLDAAPPLLRVVGLSNARWKRALHAVDRVNERATQTVGALRSELAAIVDVGVAPEAIEAIARASGGRYAVDLSGSALAPDRFDALFRRLDVCPSAFAEASPLHDARPWSTLVRGPSREEPAVDLAATLHAHLAAILPDAMVPSTFVVLAAFPLTPNGKIDRGALPPPTRVPAPIADATRAPATDLERTIATVFREMLAIDSLGADQNFFDAGANSLLLVRIHVRLSATLGVGVSLVDLFRFTTVRALATHLARPRVRDDADVRASDDRGQARRAAIRSRSER